MYWQLHPSEIEGWLCTARADAHLAVTELLKQKLHLPAAAQQLWNLTGLLVAMRGEPRVCFRFNGILHDGPWNTALGGEKEVKIHSAQSKKKKKGISGPWKALWMGKGASEERQKENYNKGQ